jgi:hypothetical protein
MKINKHDARFIRLLDLLTSCGWADMASDDMEAIANRANCDFFHGVSKGVFTCDDWDFVIKIPLYADEDASMNYCEEEYQAYCSICKNYPLCAPLFAPVAFVGWYGEIPVYAQDKIFRDLCECYWEKDTETWAENLRKETNQYICNRATSDESREFYADYRTDVSASRLASEFYYLILKTCGMAVCKSLRKWITETKQNDLHSANVGITKDFKPIIFDFSGWYD